MKFLTSKYSNSIISRKSGSAMSYWFCRMPAVGASGAIFGLVSSFNILLMTNLLHHLPHVFFFFPFVAYQGSLCFPKSIMPPNFNFFGLPGR